MTDISIKKLDSLSHNDVAATKQINDNFQAIKKALENSLSRTPAEINYMETDIDMNSRKIINVDDPVEDRDIVNKKYVDEKVGNAKSYAEAAEIAAKSASGSAIRAQEASKSCQDSTIESKKLYDDIVEFNELTNARAKYSPMMKHAVFSSSNWTPSPQEDGTMLYSNDVSYSVAEILKHYNIGSMTAFVNFYRPYAFDPTMLTYALVYPPVEDKINVKIYKKDSIPDEDVTAYIIIFMELEEK